jgi:phosphohistidine phosphatase
MKTLFLVRHAKSSHDDPMLSDRDRPLNDRGIRDARRAGARLARCAVKVDLMVSSPARRALATAEIFAEELRYSPGEIAVDERLYAASPDEVLAVIRELDAETRRVMLFGHNPEMSELAHRLSAGITRVRTSAAVQFDFDLNSWADVGRREPAKVALHDRK